MSRDCNYESTNRDVVIHRTKLLLTELIDDLENNRLYLSDLPEELVQRLRLRLRVKGKQTEKDVPLGFDPDDYPLTEKAGE